MHKVSAPGSLMLFGEHAVLHGHKALVGAVDKRISVVLRPHDDGMVSIKSELGEEEHPLNNLTVQGTFSFILACVDCYREQMERGLELTINSEFSSTIGFGSSAAVVVATLGAIAEWIPSVKQELNNPLMVAHKAKEIIQKVQGSGSGADAAASAIGGIVHFNPKGGEHEKISTLPLFSISYAGYKEETAKVIEVVKAKWANDPVKEQQIYNCIGKCVRDAHAALFYEDPMQLGKVANSHQVFLRELGVSNTDLNLICSVLNLNTEIYGAKISGSGLGDCVIAFGCNDAEVSGYKRIPASFSLEGMRIES